MPRLHLVGHLLCRSASEAETVATHLPEHLRLTRAEPGCLAFSVTRTADPLVWAVAETFTDRAAFEAHQTRSAASPWAAATAGIPRAYTITEDPA